MPDTAAETPKIITVADGLGVRQEVDNCTWIDLGGYAVVVDALEHRHKAADVIAAVRDGLGEVPVRYVINTHTHYDHVALNPDFQEQFGAEIVNHSTRDIPPEGLTFRGSRRPAQMIPAGGCHTDGDCVVWVPSDRTLLTGDLFGWGVLPLTQPLRPELAQHLEATYEWLIAFEPETVIPGHGPLATGEHLARWLAYFRSLVEHISEACRCDQTDKEILASTAPPADMRHWWRFADWKHDRNVRVVLRAVRRGGLGA
ncbi:MAG: MBL fold metallo-hydrolase [Phycisphaerae bacterium]|nr:MBL fold metallo-hydrolase [Phycisphaerae bacterium]